MGLGTEARREGRHRSNAPPPAPPPHSPTGPSRRGAGGRELLTIRLGARSQEVDYIEVVTDVD